MSKTMLPPAEIQSKLKELAREGWQRAFTTEEPHLSEMAELYESLGYEVRVEPACNELPSAECSTCYQTFCKNYKTIFIRPSKEGSASPPDE